MKESLDYLRQSILDIAMETNNGHIASAFSCIDIVNVIYSEMTDDDKFIMSKGHGCLALYAILKDKKLNPDMYKGHPDIDVKNGIECTTGSLGHGLPVAVGMALAKRIKGEPGNIYVLLGDGECQEGTTWESLMIGAHHRLDNLIVIIDRNGLQALDKTEYVLSLDNLSNKINAFECFTKEIDGHDKIEIYNSIYEDHPLYTDCPKVIIANTIKGKGIRCMENKPEWHSRIPNKGELGV